MTTRDDLKYNFWGLPLAVKDLGRLSFSMEIISVILAGILFVTQLLFLTNSFLPPQLGLYWEVQNRLKS